MANNPEFVEFILDQMQLLGPVSGRRMFGGHGLFIEGLMFGLIIDDGLYLKADESSREQYEALGLEAFSYQRGDKRIALSYFQAPEEALDDREVLLHWSNLALASAMQGAQGRSGRV